MLFNSYLFILVFLPLTLFSYYFIAPLLNLKNIPKYVNLPDDWLI